MALMNTVATEFSRATDTQISIASQSEEQRWFAVQTRSRHEKSISEHFRLRAIESYLPLYEKISRWKDRRVRIELPLFDGYIFVRIALCERLRVLEIPGVARLVGFAGLPHALPDEEIKELQSHLALGEKIGPHPYLTTGRRVAVRSGPLAGWSGILVEKRNQHRLVVSIDLIQRSIAVDIDVADVTPVFDTREDSIRFLYGKRLENSNEDYSVSASRIA